MFSLRRPNVVAIRRWIDQVDTHLHQLCDILEDNVSNSTQTNPHGLRIEESKELISGLKKLFNESSTAEQVQLITIAPKRWGRKKTERWYVDL